MGEQSRAEPSRAERFNSLDVLYLSLLDGLDQSYVPIVGTVPTRDGTMLDATCTVQVSTGLVIMQSTVQYTSTHAWIDSASDFASIHHIRSTARQIAEQ